MLYICIEAVAHRTDDGEVKYTYPASIVENTTLSGRELIVREVKKLRYQLNDPVFQDICHKEGLTKKEYEIVSARPCYELIDHNQAVKPVGSPLYSLPPSKRILNTR